jgi:ribosome-binding factor A
MGRAGRRRRVLEEAPQEGMGARSARLQELIREEVSFMFDNEIGDARLQDVRVTFVDLTPDGSCARVWYSTGGEARETARALERVTPFLRTRVAESLGLKRTPEIRFRRDDVSRHLAHHFNEEP